MSETNYQEMVNSILEHMTARELAMKTGTVERSVQRWKNGVLPQNLNVRIKIVKLYKGLNAKNAK